MMNLIHRSWIVALVLLVSAAPPGQSVWAQMLPVKDALEDYARLLQLTGNAPPSSFSARPYSMAYLLREPSYSHPWAAYVEGYRRTANGRRLRIGVYEPVTSGFFNLARPNGGNDGAVWQGRGGTALFSTGVFAKARWFSASLRPIVVYTENADFDLSPLQAHRRFSPYAYATLATRTSDYPMLSSTIDMPQRFGADPFRRFDLGASYIRADAFGLAAGFSNENLWWGPATRNAIALSNNAPGFLHGFVGTSHPLDVRFGLVEMRWIWGSLKESEYYDAISENNRRFFTGMIVAVSPHLIPGLQLGATRAFVQNMEEGRITFDDYLLVFQDVLKQNLATEDNPSGLDAKDQMITVFSRWLLPESGFELYGTWAKGDHSWNLRDFIVDFQHAGAYTAGLQKVFQVSPSRWVTVNAELTKLEAPRSDFVRGVGGYFYEHIFVRQGFTHRGQVIGAEIGPGSNSQYLGIDVFTTWGRAGGFVNRVVYNNDRYFRTRNPDNRRHEVELAAGLRGLVFARGFEFEASLAIEHLLNRYYEADNDQANVHATLTIRRSLMGYR